MIRVTAAGQGGLLSGISQPANQVAQTATEKVLVMELSSFKVWALKPSIRDCSDYQPHANHIDYHGSFENYVAANGIFKEYDRKRCHYW